MNISRIFLSSPKEVGNRRRLAEDLEAVLPDERAAQQQDDDGRDVQATTDLRDHDDDAELQSELHQQRQGERMRSYSLHAHVNRMERSRFSAYGTSLAN